jgi:hypothetical protein
MSIFDAMKRIAESFGSPTTEGEMQIRDRLRGAMRAAIKASPLSRHQIAGEMSHLCGETITKEMIDSWTRESDEANGRPARHIPAEFLPAFCKVTGCSEPLRIMGQLVGLFVLPGPEAMRAEMHRLDERIKHLQTEKRKRKAFLKEMELSQ